MFQRSLPKNVLVREAHKISILQLCTFHVGSKVKLRFVITPMFSLYMPSMLSAKIGKEAKPRN